MSLTKLIYFVVIFLIVGLSIVLFLVLRMEETEKTGQTNTSSLKSFTGQLALSCQNDQNRGIYLYDEDKQELNVFLDSAQDELMPVINHKADKLYYILQEDIYNRLVEYSLLNDRKNNLIYTKNDILSLKISDDDKKLIYLENAENTLFYYNIETDQLNEIASQVAYYAWFPDSDKFVYTKEGDMYFANFNRLSGELVKDQLIVQDVISPVAFPGLSDTFLAVAPADSGLNLVLVNANQQTINVFSKVEFSTGDLSTFKLSFSPDQANILLAISEAGDNFQTQVWTIKESGQTVTGILSGIGSPVWSSDGQSIYYNKKETSGAITVWSYNLSNQEAKPITDLPVCTSPNQNISGDNINL